LLFVDGLPGTGGAGLTGALGPSDSANI